MSVSDNEMFMVDEIAFTFARNKHKGQSDDTGKNYFDVHCRPVAEILRNIGADKSVIAAGYLHDTLEDTDTTYDELVEEFGQEIADLVNEVTHEGKKDENGFYFPRLHSREGIMIKLADRLSNISRMESWDEKRQAHYLKRTRFWKSSRSL